MSQGVKKISHECLPPLQVPNQLISNIDLEIKPLVSYSERGRSY